MERFAMSSDMPAVPTGLTFSQVHGLQPLPQPLALGKVTDHFRMDVWNWVYLRMDGGRNHSGHNVVGPWHTFFRTTHAQLFHFPLDSFSSAFEDLSEYKRLIVGREAISFNKLFDLIQFMLRLMRHLPDVRSEASRHLIEMRNVFQTNMLAYDILDIPPDGPTIVPISTPEEGGAIRQAFAALATSPFDGARAHLRLAAEAINAGSPPDGIREAINAVESTVRVIAPNKNFKDAMIALDAKAKLHPALREALSKLYAYSGDEKGIRHPLLESDVASVGMAEAVFMFGACASFVSYLIQRGRTTGVLKA